LFTTAIVPVALRKRISGGFTEKGACARGRILIAEACVGMCSGPEVQEARSGCAGNGGIACERERIFRKFLLLLYEKIASNETFFMAQLKTPKLYLIPTPVGNLEDMTFRAVRLLKEVDEVLAEDTRTTHILFRRFDIRNRMQSYHQFNEHQIVARIVARIQAGESVALVSDAGTPGISDPGFLLVRECIRQGVEVECLPGATAFVPALVASGLPSDRFCFEGFLPQKKGRKTRLEALAGESRTIILYESPFRVLRTLKQLAEFFGEERQASVSREISKLHETTVRGSFKELIAHFSTNEPRGEFVMIISGRNE
jgi:16S rRNA (cytidine1402-2'-O)-methyltransferase